MDKVIIVNLDLFTYNAKIQISKEDFIQRCELADLPQAVASLAMNKQIGQVKFICNKTFAEPYVQEILKINKTQFSNNPIEIEVIEQ